ncbi:MAG TPA: ABC transporter substrate-binding protein, partial [Burkholderiales bacterium]|nr:ABC transporter substrate-binding protein [Burkholderiales bacterium]
MPAGTRRFALTGLVDLLFSEPLLTIDWQGRARGRLAESWSRSADGRAIRLTIRDGVKFHDGTLLTLDIVRDTLRAALAGQRNIASVAAQGKDVLIQLREPDRFLPGDLSQYSIVAPGRSDVGTGPFKLISSGDEPTLNAFREYYRGAPSIDRVEFHRYPTQRAAWAAMMRGEADMLHEVSRESIEFAEQESQIRTYSTIRPYYIALVFNLRHPQLGKQLVRRALAEAVDRRTLLDAALRGRGRVAAGPIWPYHWAYSAAGPTQFNPAAARLKLDAAGLSAVSAPSKDLMPSRLRFRCMYYAEDARF